MADAVNPTVIKLTQDTLGKHVSNPSLTTKLLNKPPFKFLHDVINAVITETGFLSGLYTEAELDKDNIKDKEGKISFLQKCIDATIFATGEDLTVRPSKIVSGHEADKTNEFLQALARAVESKTDSGEAVQKVLAGEKPSKSKASKDKPSKSSDKPKSVNGIRRTSGASKENLAPTAGQDKGNEPKSPRPPIPVIKINASALITDEGLESGRTESVLNGEVEDESEEVEEDPSVITEGAHENDEASSTIASESVKLMDDKKKPPVKNNSKTTKNPKNTNRLQGKPGASKSENSKPSVGRSLNTESNSRGADRRRGEVGAAENKRTSLKDRQAKASRKSDGKVVKRTSISQPPAPKSKVQGRAKDDKSRGKVGDGKDDKSIRSRGKVGDGKEDKKRTVRDKKPSKEDVDRGARKKDSKRGSRADKPSRPGKENAPPTVTAAAAVNNEDPPPTDGVDADAALAEDKVGLLTLL
ncbi:hypothetical protein FHG87_015604 [Trinorchestia longiramus]|nr:hypothetical protein FHG87_015604 [Trinorchestia longiramus]